MLTFRHVSRCKSAVYVRWCSILIPEVQLTFYLVWSSAPEGTLGKTQKGVLSPNLLTLTGYIRVILTLRCTCSRAPATNDFDRLEFRELLVFSEVMKRHSVPPSFSIPNVVYASPICTHLLCELETMYELILKHRSRGTYCLSTLQQRQKRFNNTQTHYITTRQKYGCRGQYSSPRIS